MLLPLRFVRFRRTNEELLLLDFCYWVTALCAVWTLCALLRLSAGSGDDEEGENAFTRFDRGVARAGFAYASGALAWSLVIFSNRVIFHQVSPLHSRPAGTAANADHQQ